MSQLMDVLLADQRQLDARIAAHNTTLTERCFEALVGPKPSMTTGAVLPPKPVTAPEPQEGCEIIQCSLGDADVYVEFEYSPPDGDGWNEPHTDECVTIIGVMVNGVWADADEFSAKNVERWEQEAIDYIRDQRDAADAEQAELWAEERALRRAEL